MSGVRPATEQGWRAPIAREPMPPVEYHTGRRVRWRYGCLALLGLTACLILAAPRLLGHWLLTRTELLQAAATANWSVDVNSARVGWWTPLRLSSVRVQDGANSLHIDQITTDITFLDLIHRSDHSLGMWVVTGISLHYAIDNDQPLPVADMLSRLSAGATSGPLPTGQILIRDISIRVTDTVHGDKWQLAKSEAQINFRPDDWDAKFIGEITEDSGSIGTFEAKMAAAVPGSAVSTTYRGEVPTESNPNRWQCEIKAHSIPVSAVALIVGPCTQAASMNPAQIGGEATGTIQLVGSGDGVIHMDLNDIRIQNLQATDGLDPSRVWFNRNASLEGRLSIERHQIIANELLASTDFASLAIEGAITRSLTGSQSLAAPWRFLDAFDGALTVEVDLPSLQKSLPDTLSIKKGSQFVAGKLTLSTQALPAVRAHRRRFTLKSDTLQIQAADRLVPIEPMAFHAIVSNDNDRIKVDELSFESQFAKAEGNGDSQRGSVKLEANMGKLNERLNLVKEMSELEFGGLLDGTIRWDLTQDDQWQLLGSGTAADLHVTLDGVRTIQQNSLSGQVELLGRWHLQHLTELSQATLTLVGDELELNAELTRPVDDPSVQTPLPLHIEVAGQLEKLAGVFHSWTQKKVNHTEGQFDLNLLGDFSATSARLDKATLELSQPRIAFGNRWFGQPDASVNFDGQWTWPAGEFEAKSLTARCGAISAEVRGRAGPHATDLQLAWRAKLDRIATSFHDSADDHAHFVLQESNFRRASLRSRLKPIAKDWRLQGDCSGRIDIRRDDQTIEIKGRLAGQELALLERLPASGDRSSNASVLTQVSQTDRQGKAAHDTPSANHDLRMIWNEPTLNVEGTLRYDTATDRTAIDAVHVAGDWFSTRISGQAIWNTEQHDLLLTGPLKIKLPQLGQHLTDLAGTRVQITGTHVAPLTIRFGRSEHAPPALSVVGSVGWDSGEVAGVKFGAATIPVLLSETSIQIARTVVPSGNGHFQLAGQVDYRPGPITIQLDPGVVAESIELTEEMTERWLKYIAPPMMRVEKIHGTVGARLDQATIVLGAPDMTHVAGQVMIQQLQMSFTPLMHQLMDTLARLRDIVNGQAGMSTLIAGDHVTMPEQSIDFDLNLGLIDHKRIVFDVGETQIVCNGYVTLAGRLAMVAKIPLSHFATDAGSHDSTNEFVSVPIFGTINQPLISPTGLGNVATLLADRTAFDIGDELLRRQLKHDEVLLQDAKTLWHDTEQLLESARLIQDGLKRAADRRQSQRKREPAKTIR